MTASPRQAAREYREWPRRGKPAIPITRPISAPADPSLACTPGVAEPACFGIKDALIGRCDIPVFHDDQHGTAIVRGAVLPDALELQGKRIEDAHARRRRRSCGRRHGTCDRI